MPDLPPTGGFYQGEIVATYTIQRSGKVSDITVDFPRLTLDRKPVDLTEIKRYATESLRTRTFSERDEACVVKLAAWLN